MKKEYKEIGEGAYYRYVQKPAHRKKLQDNLNAWYQTQHRKHTQSLCERIQDVKIVPIKAERGVDRVFDEFMDAGDDVVPCLMLRVTDTTEVRNPFQSPGYGFPIRIGDVAFFIFLYLKELTADQFLPTELQEDYKTWGTRSYYEFVQEPANRKIVQDNLRKWYKKKYGNDLLIPSR